MVRYVSLWTLEGEEKVWAGMKVATLQTFVEAIRGVKVQPKESRRWLKAQNTKAKSRIAKVSC